MAALSVLRELLLSSLDLYDAQDLERMYARHVRRLRFDDRMVAASPHREAAKSLKAEIDAPVCAEEVRSMVFEAERAALQNPLLLHTVEGLVEGRDLETDHRVLSDVLMYALLLERVTRATALDSQRLLALVAHFKQVRSEVAWWRHAPLFLTLKLGSVEGPVEEMAQALVRGKTSASFWRRKLLENVLEASAADLASGHLANALVGFSLLWDRAEEIGLSEKGELSFGWSSPRQWADRYTVWNLAFVTRFSNFPYVMAKLLIPSVLSYQEEPELYLHRRTIALYLQVHWGVFMRHEHRGGVELDWSSRGEAIQSRWGRLNLASSCASWSRPFAFLDRL